MARVREILLPWDSQPQEAANVAQRFSAPIIFAYLPPVGGVNLATGVAPDGVGTITTEATPVGIVHRGGKYGYPTNISLANGATFISIWRAGTQYSGADGSRRIISNQKSGSNGFSYGRYSAIGGGSTGNLTSQRLTFHGVADYTEANATIESYVDTPVACRYNKSTGTISWFRFGVQSSPDTAASTSPPAGFATVIGGQGDFAASSELWIDKASVVLVFGGALSDAEIFDLTNSVGAVWQAFADQVIRVPVSAGGGTTITATLGTATASGYAATVNANRTIAAGVGTATASGYQASVSNSVDTTINAGLASAAASGYAANVDANRTIAATLGTATASGFAASVSNTNDTVISVSVATAAAVGYAASLNVNRTIAAALGTAQALGYAATVSNGDLQAGGQAGFVMRRMRRLIKLRFNGKLYQAFEEDIPELLETLEEQAEQKVKKKRNARSKPAPVATVVSAPDDVLPDLKARIAEVNHSIGVLWGVEDDEDEELLWLML